MHNHVPGLGRADLLKRLLGASLTALASEGRARKVASGLRWAEGPAYLPRENAWVFSDIPMQTLLRFSETEGLTVFRSPSRFANGNAATRSGELLTCEHGSRSVVAGLEGEVRILCDRFEGGRLNSPNDVVEGPDGSIWFTDPTYGITNEEEGHLAPAEQLANRVYRLDRITGRLTAEISSLAMPNGLCFAPDGATLYVADSGAVTTPDKPFNPGGPRDIWAFDSGGGRHAGNGRLLARVRDGIPDGLRCDDAGRIWAATFGGLECYSPDGTFAGALATNEIASNLHFGGRENDRVLVTLATSAWLIRLTE